MFHPSTRRGTMGEEGLEDWDADFLHQVIQLEEQAVSSIQHPPPPQSQPPPPPPPPSHFLPPNDNIYLSYSPPRELSQRPTDYNRRKPLQQSSNGAFASIPSNVRRSGNENEDEIFKWKREHGRVSKQLSQLEQECLELRKEMDKKEQQLKSVFCQVEAKDAEVQCLKSTHTDCGALQEQPEILKSRNLNNSNEKIGSRLDIGVSTCKGIGVQTEMSGDSSYLIVNHDLSNKLIGIWSSLSGQRSGRDLVSKLFVTCSTDFQVLFSCLNVNVHSRTTTTLENKSLSDFVLQDNDQSVHSSEVSKVSHLYAVLTKISSGMAQLEALFEALHDVCNLENEVIVYRSLRILHAVLNHMLSLERSSERSTLYSGTMSWLRDFALKTALWISMDMGVPNLEVCCL